LAPRKKTLSGRYIRSNEAFLHQRARRQDDPRHVFYIAMLSNVTYDAYEAMVGSMQVIIPNFKKGPISGHMEMLYARRSGWIVDDGT
jgi:hypothetical protein